MINFLIIEQNMSFPFSIIILLVLMILIIREMVGFFVGLPSPFNWNLLIVIAAFLSAIFASRSADAALKSSEVAQENLSFDREPFVQAVGVFELDDKTNGHTFQLINVGRGPARNVILSKRKSKEGGFLDNSNPYSFALSSNMSTKKDLGEKLVIPFNKINKEKDSDNDGNCYFYIYFENYKNKPYYTKVRVREIEGKGYVNRWKVMDNALE